MGCPDDPITGPDPEYVTVVIFGESGFCVKNVIIFPLIPIITSVCGLVSYVMAPMLNCDNVGFDTYVQSVN